MSEADDPKGSPPAAPVRDAERERVRAVVRARLFGGPAHLERIDRFVVLERLGAGATGIVYEAYDPRLERKVALKRVRRAVLDDDAERAAALSARLVREAQALARVSHPNVVTVHDVVTLDDDVYVAMERVSGEPLRAWMAERRPRDATTWRWRISSARERGSRRAGGPGTRRRWG
jgi:serine/threonine protein kinase